MQRLEFGVFPVSAVAPLTGGEAVAVLYLLCAVTAEFQLDEIPNPAHCSAFRAVWQE